MADPFHDLRSRLGINEEDQDAIAAVGRAALETGVVTPDEALFNIGPEAVMAARDPASLVKTGEQRTLTEKEKESAKTKQFFKREELDQIVKNLTSQPIFQQAKSAIDRQQQMLSLLASQPVRTDFTPLFSLVDSITGTNLAKATPRPQDNTKLLTSLAANISQQRRSLLNSVVSSITPQVIGTSIREGVTSKVIQEQISDPTLKVAGSSAEQNLIFRAEDKVRVSLGKINDDFKEASSASLNIRNALQENETSGITEGTLVKLKSAARQLVKIVEGPGSRVSTQDVADFAPLTAKGLVARVKQFSTSKPGKEAPDIIQDLLELNFIFSSVAKDKMLTDLDRRKKEFQASKSVSGRVDLPGLFAPSEKIFNEFDITIKKGRGKTGPEAEVEQLRGLQKTIKDIQKRNEEIKKKLGQ